MTVFEGENGIKPPFLFNCQSVKSKSVKVAQAKIVEFTH